jgi:hypothetical protein
MLALLRRTAALGVVLGLTMGFGSGAAELAAVCAQDCPPPYHGTCVNQDECVQLCIHLFPENMGAGICDDGCCMCAER